MSSTHETIEYDRFPAQNVRDLVNTAVHTGTIVEVDYDEDTAKIDINGVGIKEDIPIFYHCFDREDVAGGSIAFTEGDRVYILEKSGVVSPDYIITGFVDGLKSCAIWVEDWEGATIITNHDWTYLSAVGSGCGTVPDAAQYSFGGENVLKIESIAISSNYCGCSPEVDLTSSPEVPLNLGYYSGFSCEAYLAEFEPQTYTSANCLADCTLSWSIRAFIALTFYWRPIGGSPFANYTNYGIDMGVTCYYDAEAETCYYGELFVGAESFTTFIARIGSWSVLPHLSGTVVPWQNSNYELTYIVPNIFLAPGNHAMTVHGTTNMKVYFSDITIK